MQGGERVVAVREDRPAIAAQGNAAVGPLGVVAADAMRVEDRLGIEAEEAPGTNRAGPDVSAACFEVPSAYEITVGGKKLIGSAQARRKEGVLQHGSLPLVGDLARITKDEGERMIAALPATLSPVVIRWRWRRGGRRAAAGLKADIFLKDIVHHIKVKPQPDSDPHHQEQEKPHKAHVRCQERIEEAALWVQQGMIEQEGNRDKDHGPGNLVPLENRSAAIISQRHRLEEDCLECHHEEGQAGVLEWLDDPGNLVHQVCFNRCAEKGEHIPADRPPNTANDRQNGQCDH